MLEQENAAKNATVTEESEVLYMDDDDDDDDYDDDEIRLVSNSNFDVEDRSEEAKIQNSIKIIR